MLQLYNTLTRKTEPFQRAEDKQVKMYTCGPSTYQPAHIGNYRTFLYEDVLLRYLEYLGFNVKRVMTLTNVEDKAIAEAKKENLTVEELTQKNEAIFFKDFELLKIERPDYPIRASSAVDQAVNLISQLIEKGYAYIYMYKGAKNVYFDPLKFKGFGKLAHLDLSKWPKKKRRFHKDTYSGTPWNLGDFVLWHGCKGGDVCYEASIGSGRPAWNIQDAAIVTRTIGYSVDVACGGIDNLVRHHDYTLAVAEAVSGRQFSRFWLHGGHLLVEGKKMSKSAGNMYYPSDLVAKGFNGKQIRFFLIYGAYREKLNFTFEGLAETSRRLDALRDMIVDLQNREPSTQKEKQGGLADEILLGFEQHMNDDLNVKGAFDYLYPTISGLCQAKASLATEDKTNLVNALRRVDSVLQCLF